jgi:hypothetical protein
MRLSLGLAVMTMSNEAWSFVVPQRKYSTATKVSMAEGDEEEGPVMNKFSR